MIRNMLLHEACRLLCIGSLLVGLPLIVRSPLLSAPTAVADRLLVPAPNRWSEAATRHSTAGLVPIDIGLPSASTGSPTGTLAVRVHTPRFGHARYAQGAPVLIWGEGGYEAKDIGHGLPPETDDIIVISFLFPGGHDAGAGVSSDGTYDMRGMRSVGALHDVIRYAAGMLADDQGRTIDQIVPVPVLHDNIGLEGVSNGGNIVVAVAALKAQGLAGRLRYIIQWETPVSSQVATRDFGRVLMKPSSHQADLVNPRYGGYDPTLLPSFYGDLAYDPSEPYYPIFHDGNGDGLYTTVQDPATQMQTPDLNLDGSLSLTEDFPLDAYPHPSGTLRVYSRGVSEALLDQNTFSGTWPTHIANPGQASDYWDIRASVHLYADAVANLPNLEAMLLCGVRDHVQALPDKPHIRQAFEGWHDGGAWVRINPSPTYLIETDPGLAGRDDLPNRVPNQPPIDWVAAEAYCIPQGIASGVYQLAAARQMADRAQGVLQPAPPGAERITYIDSGGDAIAVRLEVPQTPRYPSGAPVVVEASTWFVPGDDFHRVNDTTQIGAVTVSYLWPERIDVESGARSEGVYDYGGPDSLEALRDVLRFASGTIPDTEGHTIQALIATDVLTDNVGMFASSHAGVVATNVLAQHGAEIPRIKYLVGRENPTRDEMYACELGHFDSLHIPVYNPFFEENAYDPLTVSVAYSTVGWYEDPHTMDRPVFRDGPGQPVSYTLAEKGPRLWDNKRYYSRALTRALLESGDLTSDTWPADVATYTETLDAWPQRIAVHSYPDLITQTPELRVMLVFASSDHVQAPQTKPHIHQAWDGFHGTANLWVRMNPDTAYVQTISPTLQNGLPDNPANAAPSDWSQIESWGFSAGPSVRAEVWLASVAEMADRVHTESWSAETDDIDAVLVHYPPATLSLPIILRDF